MGDKSEPKQESKKVGLTKIEIVTEPESEHSNQTILMDGLVRPSRSSARSPAQKLSLQLDAQPAHTSPGLSPRSPCRPLSPHLGIVSKLYEEEILVNELTSTPQLDPEFIEQIQQKKHLHQHSPGKSPDHQSTNRKSSFSQLSSTKGS